MCLRFIGDTELLQFDTVVMYQASFEALRFGLCSRFDRPVLLGFKRFYFQFPLHDHAQCGALDTTCGKTATDFFPQQGGEFEADQIIQGAACLLGIDERLRKQTWVLNGFSDGPLGDLMEHHAIHRLVFQQVSFFQKFIEMPRNGLSFAVRVGCQIDCIGFLGCIGYSLNMFEVFLDDFILHEKIMIGIDSAFLGHKIAHMTIGGVDFKVFAQIFFNSLGLGR